MSLLTKQKEMLETPDLESQQKTLKTLKVEARRSIIREIQAFAGDYSHDIQGFDVVRVDQLLDFLQDFSSDSE